MTVLRLTAAALLVSLSATAAAAAETADPALTVLLQQAEYWRAQQHPDQAMASLRRALALAPDNPDALSMLAQLAADAGDQAAADDALAHLRQVAPQDPRIAAIGQAVRIGPISADALAEARRLAAAGKPAEARAAYDRLFKGGSPPDALAVEYYQTLAGTEDGWAPARDGLARLVRRAPDDLRAQLAYAEVLTYQEATRRDGVARLAVLARNPAIAAEAAKAWRQGLLWLPASADNAALLAPYAAAHPDDADIAAHLQTAQHPAPGADPGDIARSDGFAALDKGNLADAASLFQQALTANPDDADAAGGLGLVRLRQHNPAEAKTLLARAIALDPDNRARWQAALTATTAPPEDGRQARAQHLREQAAASTDPAEKLALTREAVAADPANPWLRLDLARLLAKQGQMAEAQATMAAATTGAAGVDALRAGVIFAQESDDGATAARLIGRLPAAARTPEMRTALAQAETERQIAAAVALPRAEARRQLLAIAAAPDPDGARGAAIARALAGIGDPQAAAQAVATAAAATPAQGAAARLRYAGALLDAGQADAAHSMLAGIGRSGPLTPAQRQAVADLQAGLAVRDSDRLNEAGRQADAYDRLAPVLAVTPDNADANLALGRLYQSAHRAKQALDIAQAVLARDPGNLAARQQAVSAALALGDRAQAASLAAAALDLAPNDPRAWLMAADVEKARGHAREALRDLERARDLRQQQVGGAAGQNPRIGALVNDLPAAAPAANPFREGDTLGDLSPDLTTVADPLTAEIDRSISDLREQVAPAVQAGTGFRSRSGDTGLDRLDELTLPMEASFAPGGQGRLKLTLTPTILNGGTLGGATGNAQRFGTGVFSLSQPAGGGAPVLTSVGPGDQGAQGFALSASYAVGSFAADIGTTPLGFREQNFVGGVEWAPQITDRTRLRLTLERRAVLDSVLSFAGTVDPRTGLAWGGVTRTGAHANLEFSAGPADLYAGGGWQALQGQNVASNTETELGAGGSAKLWQSGTQELRVGTDLVYFGYTKNLDYFTYGQGGYFSPQSYVAALLPVTYKDKVDADFSYEVGVAPGLQSYRASASPYFPTDAALQSQLVAMQANPATAVTGVLTEFPANSESGLAGNAHANFDYRLAPELHLGGQFNALHAGNFTELSGLLYARYVFGIAPP